jgi:arsenical pump membrane protein
MEQAVAYSTLALTVGLAVTQPRLGRGGFRVTPGLAALLGVVLLLATGVLRPGDVAAAAGIQWRPLLALTCIMVMTGVVKEVGAFERLALRVEAHARATSTARAFHVVFLASVLTPSLLNNDAAILLLTPVVVALARRLYPGDARAHEAFAFVVFLAAGVAPFIISNPMNMIVAEFVGLDFNSYAAVMAPIALVGAVLTFAILRLAFRSVLATSMPAGEAGAVPPAHPAERPAFACLLVTFLSYPVVAALDGPIWPVAAAGAVGCVAIARIHDVASLRTIAGHVSIDVLAFLWGIFLVVVGLRNVGVADHLAGFYATHAHHEGLHLGVVGTVSAVGSAIVDNHPMAILNMMALKDEASTRPLLAALVGGDLGPRLLPIGSLAGLLWIDLLRRRGIEIGVRRFFALGALVLVPTLVASLLLLWAL